MSFPIFIDLCLSGKVAQMTQALFSAEFDIWVYFSDVSLSFHLLSRWAWHLLGTRVEPARWSATESWSKWRKGTRRTSTWSGKLDRRSEVLQLWILTFLIEGTEHQKVETEKEKRKKQQILAVQNSVAANSRQCKLIVVELECISLQLLDRLFPYMMSFLEY